MTSSSLKRTRSRCRPPPARLPPRASSVPAARRPLCKGPSPLVSRSSRRSPLPPPLTAQRWRDQVEELLRQDRINADSEWSLYQHLLRWMSHHSDPSESLLAPADETGPVRGGHLLAHVRWPLLGKEVLWKQVWHHQSLGNMWHHAEPYVAEATMLLNASEEM